MMRTRRGARRSVGVSGRDAWVVDARSLGLAIAALAVVVGLGPVAPVGAEVGADMAPGWSDPGCRYQSPAFWRSEIARGVARGKIASPRARLVPDPAPASATADGCLSSAQVFAYEDTDGLLVTNYDPSELYDLMVDAANELIGRHGDVFDFIGFWTNFDPIFLFGTAFYLPIVNDVLGIGDAGAAIGEGPRFDLHLEYGLAGARTQGFIHMWNVNATYWQPGEGPEAAQTRLVLGHEYAHRYGIFLPPLLDGRPMQGDNIGCGNAYHWNNHVDGQGSSIQLSDWAGTAPAERLMGVSRFNADTGGVYSYLELYLMGYVEAAEVDAGMSELRYLENDCISPYDGPIADFSINDIRASVGPRIPGVDQAQKDFRTGWIMIHQPGAPPTEADRAKAVAIAAQHALDYNWSTLGRGTMNHMLFADCNCNGIPDSSELGGGADVDGNGVLDICEPCRADLNGDEIIGLADVLLLAVAWGPCDRCPEDLDGSGAVGVEDLIILLGFWGSCG